MKKMLLAVMVGLGVLLTGVLFAVTTQAYEPPANYCIEIAMPDARVLPKYPSIPPTRG
ncbi:MAG: hypothetical protein FWC16_07235 [Defluviitaleaceae bacterium]|nr:hypothetical protein [Defluviitaleaceae bacterium]MCL2274706.1 hypothetical protein [Defluviitaleaceae bacterium]